MRQRLAWSADAVRHFDPLVVALLAHPLTSLPERPVVRPLPPELGDRFRSAAMPLTTQEPEEILAEFVRDVEPYPSGTSRSAKRVVAWNKSTTALEGLSPITAYAYITPRPAEVAGNLGLAWSS